MNNSPEILNELKAISPLLAGLEKVNVFTVPEGYFKGLSDRLYNFAIFSSSEEFTSNKKANVQQVPAGYFESLSTNILAKVKELYPETGDEELRKVSPVIYSLKKENVFKVPDDYFNKLASSILEKIKKLSPETANEELRNLSPMLYVLRDEVNVFEVPEGYFEGFAAEVIKKVKPAPARVVAMRSRNWLRITAAAVVAGIIAISSLQIFNLSNQDEIQSPAAVSANIPDYVKESFRFKTEAQVNAGIAKLSEDEIVKYLERNGNVMDNDLLLKNTDVSELPDQVDYLTDENTLNTYLEQISGESDTN